MGKLIYEEETYLKNSDFNHQNIVKPHGVLGLFEDIAGRHATILKIGYEDMINKNLAWVVIRNKMTIYKMPEYDEKVKVITWPHKRGKIDFDRDYEVLNSKNEILFNGSSKWVVIDLKTRRLSRALDINYDGEIIDKQVYPSLDKLIKPNLEFKKIAQHIVCLNDIDHNGHMNNARYLEMIYNTFTYDRNMPKEITIEYMHEAKYGEHLDIYYASQEQTEYYLISSLNEDKVLVKMEE